jgi:hypothetical protein
MIVDDGVGAFHRSFPGLRKKVIGRRGRFGCSDGGVSKAGTTLYLKDCLDELAETVNRHF